MTTTLSSKEKSGRGEASFNLKAAMAPALGLIALGILPEYLKVLYGAYTDQLLRAYVTAGYVFLGSVFAGMAVVILRDFTRTGVSETISRARVFGWRPGESYLSGAKKTRGKPTDRTEEDTDSTKES
ncbi:MAG: hypothetical protein OHK006_04290 [Thermodesulfovibrionales bacterium]